LSFSQENENSQHKERKIELKGNKKSNKKIKTSFPMFAENCGGNISDIWWW